MRSAAFLLLAVGAAACASSAPLPRTAQAETALQRELAGKVFDGKVLCLPAYRRNDMVIIDNNTILFRDGNSTVYRNDPQGGCSPLGSGFYTLLTVSIGAGGLCRGDIARVVDLSSRMTVGSCVLGDFVRYKTASR